MLLLNGWISALEMNLTKSDLPTIAGRHVIFICPAASGGTSYGLGVNWSPQRPHGFRISETNSAKQEPSTRLRRVASMRLALWQRLGTRSGWRFGPLRRRTKYYFLKLLNFKYLKNDL